LGIGVFEDLEDLLDQRWGKKNYQIIRMEINWAENAGLWLNGIAPLLLSVGLVLLFIEFKTPGFGVFGILGIGFILIFFGSKYVAGLAGQEELLLFLVGFCLILVEVFLAPGLFFPALLGLALMFGSLIWAMVDIWPGQEIEWSFALFRVPLVELAQSFGLAFILGYFAIKIMGKTPMGKSMLLETSVGNQKSNKTSVYIEPNKVGVTVSELYPVGKIQIDGKTYEARSAIGKIEKGQRVKVIKQTGYEIVVEEVTS
jgi:membrane-bound serine protease (ClpP class)